MKLISFLLITSLVLSGSSNWLVNFDDAVKIAKEKHQLILLNFSGSDWCGPCIRLKKEIFKSEDFLHFADSNLVLLNADFPRNKKNRLSKAQVAHNESLADKYNPEGKFPYTLLLNSEGRILKIWDGFPNGNASIFVEQIKVFTNVSN